MKMTLHYHVAFHVDAKQGADVINKQLCYGEIKHSKIGQITFTLV